MDDATVTIPVEVPQDLLNDVGLSTHTAGKALLRAFVLSLYRQDRISTGKAAQLLSIHRLDFIRILAEERTPYLDYTPEELEAELDLLEQWSNRS